MKTIKFSNYKRDIFILLRSTFRNRRIRMRLFLKDDFLKAFFNRKNYPDCWISISAVIHNIKASPGNGFELQLSNIKSRCINNKLRVIWKTSWIPTKYLKFKNRIEENPLLLVESTLNSGDSPIYKAVGEIKMIEQPDYASCVEDEWRI